MRFTKMQGAGNDYLFVETASQSVPHDLSELARQMSDRHFGVGADGLILITSSTNAAARMRMFNADGSEAEMCGNGIRCFAKYLYDHGICRRPRMPIETGAGILWVDLETHEGVVRRVRVDMGEPILDAERIPTRLLGNPVANAILPLEGQSLEVTCVSMGNPHCVTYVDQLTDDLLRDVGPRIERDAHFPQRVNVEFVQIVSPREVRQRTWERGSGETLACGTGASAVCVAGVLTNRTERQLVVHLLGGDLELEWHERDNHVYMTGPAEEVFCGDWPACW